MRRIDVVVFGVVSLALLLNAAALVFFGVAVTRANEEATTAPLLVLPTPVPLTLTAPPSLTPVPTKTAVPPTHTATATAVARLGVEHTARAGETLWSIATLYYGSGQAWPTLLDANPELAGRKALKAGDVLFVPRPEGGVPNTVTTPPAHGIPIRASWYTLEPIAGLDDAANVNCDDDCSHLALVRFDPAFYGRVAACPKEWLGLDKTARLTINGLGVVHCLDAGTAIKLTYRKVSGYGDEPLWVYEVDFLCRTEPVFHGRLYEEWQIAWVPLEEAIAAAQMGETIC